MNASAKDSSNARRQWTLLESHCRIFGVRDDSRMTAFRDLATRAGDDSYFECSVKLDGESIHPARVNLWFPPKEHEATLHVATDFVRSLIRDHGGTFNPAVLDAIVTPEFQYDSVLKVIAGIDFRDGLRDSRVKIGLVIRSTNLAALSAILATHGCNDCIRDLVSLHDWILIGIDFSMDNGTRLKIYPCIDRNQWDKPDTARLASPHLSPGVVARVHHCLCLYVSFAPGTLDKLITFFGLDDARKFAADVGSPGLMDLVERTPDVPISNYAVTLSEKELANGCLRRLNYYYTSQTPPEIGPRFWWQW